MAAAFGGLLMLLGTLLPVQAQFLPALDTTGGQQVTSPQFLPVFSQGNVELSPVFLDGRIIGSVSGFIDVKNSGASSGNDAAYSASQRAFVIHSRLQKILTSMTTFTARVSAESVDSQRQPNVVQQRRQLARNLHTFVREAGSSFEVFLAFPRSDPPELVYTVTPADVARVRTDSSEPVAIARRVASKVRGILLDAWEERQPPALWRSARRAGLGLLVITLASGLGMRLQKLLRRRQHAMSDRLRELTLEAPDPEAGSSQEIESSRRQAPRLVQLRMSLRQKLSLLSFYRSSLFWGQCLLWTCGIAWAAGLFYWTRPFSNWIFGISVRGLITTGLATDNRGWPPLDWVLTLGKDATIGTPLLILFLVMITRISIKAGNFLSHQSVSRWARQQTDTRAKLRAPTLSRSLRAWVRVGVYLLLGMVIFYQLHQLGAVTQAVAILLGFLSFALSLASQNLLKDLIGGLMILIEDQFAAGDVVVIGDQSGLVESVGLRVTQLRNLDGELISIPNGTITTVRNLSSSWSRVNYALTVSIGADVDAVMALMESVAQDLFRDPAWAERILEPPEMLGIDEIAHTGVLIRILIKTQPLQQWPVGREYRRRLKQALDAAGIDVGVPRLDLIGPALPRPPAP
ncbi:mechanosensitive ion channel family protein [Cyanobium sp. NIES-981]|uniref:mechanosensitive ion channel family protein n=1 Tax=Cyanobium sp. NIES-981 TaxID=1851505 RepID=UPI0015600EB6|nr:mechanosensitive ion channel family protein [Cyanobium sp. NIES-981]